MVSLLRSRHAKKYFPREMKIEREGCEEIIDEYLRQARIRPSLTIAQRFKERLNTHKNKNGNVVPYFYLEQPKSLVETAGEQQLPRWVEAHGSHGRLGRSVLVGVLAPDHGNWFERQEERSVENVVKCAAE